jgi:probable HAF family extracellular repeat protein
MKHMAHNGCKALISACVLSMMATVAWSQSLTWLGTLGGDSIWAYGVSADGAVVVGLAYNAARQARAFRWTASGGMQDLGTLPGDSSSEAWGVSADGAVVVGKAYNFGGQIHAFRWTASGGMQDLGTPGGSSEARGVSADGAVVVGKVYNAGGRDRAFRWTASDGMEDLNTTYYACLLTDGSVLRAASAISPNGRYIVGWGTNAATRRSEAFLLDTGFPPRGDVNRNGCVDDADLLAVLFAFGGQGYRNEDLNWDGTIDDADLLIVLFNFGSGC